MLLSSLQKYHNFSMNLVNCSAHSNNRGCIQAGKLIYFNLLATTSGTLLAIHTLGQLVFIQTPRVAANGGKWAIAAIGTCLMRRKAVPNRPSCADWLLVAKKVCMLFMGIFLSIVTILAIPVAAKIARSNAKIQAEAGVYKKIEPEVVKTPQTFLLPQAQKANDQALQSALDAQNRQKSAAQKAKKTEIAADLSLQKAHEIVNQIEALKTIVHAVLVKADNEYPNISVDPLAIEAKKSASEAFQILEMVRPEFYTLQSENRQVQADAIQDPHLYPAQFSSHLLSLATQVEKLQTQAEEHLKVIEKEAQEVEAISYTRSQLDKKLLRLDDPAISFNWLAHSKVPLHSYCTTVEQAIQVAKENKYTAVNLRGFNNLNDSHLETLFENDNQIENLSIDSESITSLPKSNIKLKVLFCHCCFLQELNEIPTLEWLHLSSLAIKKLPQLENLKSLKILKCEQLSALPIFPNLSYIFGHHCLNLVIDKDKFFAAHKNFSRLDLYNRMINYQYMPMKT